jgi:hypothetical protein
MAINGSRDMVSVRPEDFSVALGADVLREHTSL